jgi:hypothetical protein
MPTIKTTTKDFLEGVAVKDDQPTIEWESTGYLHVRLMDEFGQAPLADRALSVFLPTEGPLELRTDADGVVFHPDVPFQDYDLSIDGQVVCAPAVADRGTRHERHVPGQRVGFVNLLIVDDGFTGVGGERFTLSGPATVELTTAEGGLATHPTPLPAGAYQLEGAAGRAAVTLGARADGFTIVQLQPLEAS